MFSFYFIGKKYEEEIWSNVASMDACHILLERHWLYDRKVLYDGFKHVYFFKKDEHKVALVLLKLSLISKPSNREENTLLIQGGKLEEVGEDFLEHVILGFSLIGKGNFQEFPFVIDL